MFTNSIRTASRSAEHSTRIGNELTNTTRVAMPTNIASHTFTFTIAAGQTFPLTAQGNYFFIRQTTLPVKVRQSHGIFDDYSSLDFCRCENIFTLLEFQNTNTVPIQVVVFVGTNRRGTYAQNYADAFSINQFCKEQDKISQT